MNAVGKCQHSVFIFDKVDQFDEDVLLMLASILKDLSSSALAPHEFYRPIFIFLSDIAANQIKDRLLAVIKGGRSRDEATIFDFDVLWDNIYVSKRATHNTLIPKDIIDYFVPFLPMERKYVEKCVADELKLDNLIATDAEMR